MSFGANTVSAIVEENAGIIPVVKATIANELVVESAPVVVGTGANETGAIIPGPQGTGANQTGAIIPNPNGTVANQTGAIVPNPRGSIDDTATVVPPVVPPVTPPGGGGSPSGPGGGSGNVPGSSGSSRIQVLVSATTTPVAFSTTSCPLITDYLKFGGVNSAVQVTKLQIFLKNSEKSAVDVNGLFDQKTEDAVKAFQLKYLPSVLGPWDATRATGFVYITTSKKINELACASPIVLSAEEQAVIVAYKAGSSGDEATIDIGSGSNINATGTLEVGDLSDEENVAAIGGASILSRFWEFIKNLFR